MRMLHTMLRVGDLERSKEFYTKVMGMKLLREHEFPEGQFTLAFVGYGDEKRARAAEGRPPGGHRRRRRLRDL